MSNTFNHKQKGKQRRKVIGNDKLKQSTIGSMCGVDESKKRKFTIQTMGHKRRRTAELSVTNELRNVDLNFSLHENFDTDVDEDPNYEVDPITENEYKLYKKFSDVWDFY